MPGTLCKYGYKERSSLFVIDNSHTSDLIVPINNVTVFCGKAYNRPVHCWIDI